MGWKSSSCNLKDILNGKNVNEDAHVMPGDMIFVPEKFITKFGNMFPIQLDFTQRRASCWF